MLLTFICGAGYRPLSKEEELAWRGIKPDVVEDEKDQEEGEDQSS